jgi:hypothetical protein
VTEQPLADATSRGNAHEYKDKTDSGGVVALALGALLLPRLARRIDSTLDSVREKAAVHEAQYREMTNAYRIAGEVMPDHPTRRLWDERRSALVEAGYIETREIPLKQRLDARWSSRGFFDSFHARFPGVECSVAIHKAEQTLVAVVTARKTDFGSIERFVSRYESNRKP